ncbi:hypothetical protein DUI87_02757 [Hirundo rustica rustica]|uniref:Uncharacterized protein n=1 Tax=Hirundo rustica rustica TaxID=333673 RepID=A0A3M0LA53_HIRRU|nr:hypothetical protein DUI87_02757 [Hirundo rustica rustica]
MVVVKQMRDFPWGTTNVTPESPLGQEVGKFIGYCCEAGTVKRVQTSGTELPLHCSKPVYCGVVTQENAPADDWQASTLRRPELQWGPQDPRDDREANEGNFRPTLTGGGIVLLLGDRVRCTQCEREQCLSQIDFENEILKLMCGKSYLVPETWGVQEEDWKRTMKVCEKRFGWKRDKKEKIMETGQSKEIPKASPPG